MTDHMWTAIDLTTHPCSTFTPLPSFGPQASLNPPYALPQQALPDNNQPPKSLMLIGEGIAWVIVHRIFF
jgi:hypothetical protein